MNYFIGAAAGWAICLIAFVALLYRRGKLREARRHRTAQADEIALSMQFGGASDFQHDGSFNK